MMGDGPGFATTHWSYILQAQDASSPKYQAALAELIRRYWKPVYFFVRRAGFAAAVTTHLGVSERSTDRYQLPRFTPWNPTPLGFMAQITSMYRNVVC